MKNFTFAKSENVNVTVSLHELFENSGALCFKFATSEKAVNSYEHVRSKFVVVGAEQPVSLMFSSLLVEASKTNAHYRSVELLSGSKGDISPFIEISDLIDSTLVALRGDPVTQQAQMEILE